MKINLKHSFTVGSITRDFEFNAELPDDATADQIQACFEGLAAQLEEVTRDLSDVSADLAVADLSKNPGGA